jgi:hypothetical protein
MVVQSRETAAVENGRVTVARALRVLELESPKRTHARGWVETGAVADALGVSVGEAAASLRVAAHLGLCSRRRSLLHGTVWKLGRRRAGGAAGSIER